jgi:hypothetical protein
MTACVYYSLEMACSALDGCYASTSALIFDMSVVHCIPDSL